MSSLLMKAVFWMFTTFMLILMSSLLLPGDNAQNEVRLFFIYICKFHGSA